MNVDDGWQTWIFENLLLGCDPRELRRQMIDAGIAPTKADNALQSASTSPFLMGAIKATHQLQERVKKREWVLDIYRQLSRLRPAFTDIARKPRLSGEAFFNDYYMQNLPVIITDMLAEWPALSLWTYDYLKQRIGDREVEVQADRDGDTHYERNGTRHRRLMQFAAYVDLVASGQSGNDVYMTANNSSHNKTVLRELWQDMPCLSEYLDPSSPDDGFFWFGPAGTVTPFHHDLSNIIMSQVKGRKRVLLMPACDLAYVYNDVHCYTPVDGADIDFQRFPRMREARVLECVLEPGEILFLPVGWWHHVTALDPSITVSFTNFRVNNVFHSTYTTFEHV